MNGTNVPIHYFLYEKSRGGGKTKTQKQKQKQNKKLQEKIGFFVEKVSPRAQKVLAESSILLWSATF